MPDSHQKRGPKTPGGRTGALVSWAVIAAIVAFLAAANAGLFDRGVQSQEEPAGKSAELLEPAPGTEPGIELGTNEPEEAQPEPRPELKPEAPGPASEESTAEAEEIAGADARSTGSAMFEMVARSVVGAPSEGRAESMKNIDLVAQTDADRLRLAILTGYVNNTADGLRRLDELSKRKDVSADLLSDIATLRTLYTEGESGVSAENAARMAERHPWFWHLAKASTTEPGSEARLALERDAKITYRITSGFILALLLLFVASLGLFISAIVLIALGKVRTAYLPPAPGGSAYLETFAAFLVAFTALSLGLDFAAAYGPESVRRLAEPAMNVLRWVLLGVASWPLLRGATWRELRAAIGWTTPRGFFREVGCGLAGYVAALPLIGMGILVTLGLVALEKLVRHEDIAMPSHPLPEMIARAGPVETVLLVILATLWAPIVEETFFRGALYHHLRGRLHWALAALASGAIFAGIHPQGILAIPPLLTIAMVLAMLREWRGSLVASMTAHCLNNGIITLLLLLTLKIQ